MKVIAICRLPAAALALSGFIVPSLAVETDDTAQRIDDSDAQVRVLLVPDREAKLSSQMDGLITAYNVDDGDAFNKGDVLVRFDCMERRANLNASSAQLKIAQETYKSKMKLKDHNAVSDLDLEIARATVDKAEAEQQLNQVMVDRCTITAPYDGRVVERLANTYENVAYGTELLDIVDKSRLRLELLLPSDWLRWLEEGQAFDFTIDETGGQYRGTVTMIGAKIDSVSQTIPVYATIQGGQQDLLPGMSGTAFFDRAR